MPTFPRHHYRPRLTAAAGVCLLAACASPATAQEQPSRAEADRIMRLDGAAYTAVRASPTRPRAYDWTTDGCTLTPRPWALSFRPACRLHDFGYRNYGRGLRLGRDERTRRWIDGRFRTEMLRLCAARPARRYARSLCRIEASTMYLVVRGANYWGS